MKKLMPRPQRALSILAALAAPAITLAVVAPPADAASTGPIYITEWEYNGSEFVEFTNTSTQSVNLSGWSYSDSAQKPGDVSLSSLGTVAAGESFIISEASATDFRTAWNLCSNVKVLGGNAKDNLGRSDEINLYNGSTLADRLTFNDQGSGTVAGPRTDSASAYVPVAYLGANNASKAVLSASGDAVGSWASVPAGTLLTGSYIGSPGSTPAGSYNECPTGGDTSGAPTLSLSAPGLAGSVDNTANPALPITVGPAADAANLTVTATSSSSASVAATSDVTFTGAGTDRTVAVHAHGTTGLTTITLKVTNTLTQASSTATFSYGASAAVNQSSERWFSGAANASTAIDAGDGYAWVADDESNVLRLYDLASSGAPVKTFDIASAFGTSFPEEIDIEAAARTGNTIYWTGSMSNKNDGTQSASRNALFATTISGTGADSTLTKTGSVYTGLRTALRNFDTSDTYGLKTGTNTGTDGHDPSMMNVEGLEFAPGSSTTAYLGFRGPVKGNNALIVPITNLPAMVTGTAPVFGTPIKLDLGGYGIREMRRNADGQFIISAGDSANAGFRFYTWTGVAADAPVNTGVPVPQLPASDDAHLGTWEAIASVPDPLVSGSTLRVLQDDGDVEYYQSGVTSKDGVLPDLQKSLSVAFTIPTGMSGTLTSTPTPAITGQAAAGSTLVAVPGTWDDGVTLTYAWAVDGTAAGASNTLAVTPQMAGKTVQVAVTGTKTGYTSVTKTSTATTIAKAVATISVLAPATTRGDAPTVHVTVSASGLKATGTVTAGEGGTALGSATLADGEADIVLPTSLGEGGHTLTISYDGNGQIAAGSTSTQLTIAPPAGVDVAGTVVDDAGSGVANACVYFYAPDQEATGASYASCTVNNNGDFGLLAVPVGDYTVAVADPTGAHDTYWRKEPVSVNAGMAPLSITLSASTAPGAVAGTVTAGDTKAAVPGACVYAYPAGRLDHAVAATCANTDGDYWLGAQAASYDVAFLDPAAVYPNDWENGVAVAAGATTTLNPVMKAATSAQVYGTVTDKSGPIAGACAYLYPAGTDSADLNASASYGACTQSDGSYWMGSIPVGNYTLAVSDGVNATSWQAISVTKDTKTDVELIPAG